MKTGWEIKKIKDICDKASSNIAMNKITDIDGIYPVYGASGFVQNVDFFHRDTPYIGIVKDGAGVGRVNVYPAYSSLLGTLQYILPKEGNSINYVAYALKSLNLASSVTGATIPHIYFKDYGEIKLPIPPLPEQERIVSELDLISGVIEKKKQQLKELDSLAQSVFYEMFGNPVENEKGWDVKKLTDVCSIQYGCPFDASLFSTSKTEGMPLIRIRDVKGGKTATYYTGSYTPEFIIHKGDYLIGMDGEFNIAPWQSEDALLNQRVCKIDSKSSDVTIQFVYRFLTKELKRIEDDTPFATVKHLSAKRLNQVHLSIPPLPLQQEFASKIEKIERQKVLIKQSLQETETLFNSRMDFYFN